MGRACIRGRLYLVAHYPGLTPPEGQDDWVTGDVFEGVTAGMLERLDDYEGSAYIRQLTEVSLDGGGKVAAYVYCYAMPTDGLEWITSGDWNRVNGTK
jgi:gamma-glutamylcyclotransferase (GGCT)/AIG2-like uncharacterized protein YtfP